VHQARRNTICPQASRKVVQGCLGDILSNKGTVPAFTFSLRTKERLLTAVGTEDDPVRATEGSR